MALWLNVAGSLMTEFFPYFQIHSPNEIGLAKFAVKGQEKEGYLIWMKFHSFFISIIILILIVEGFKFPRKCSKKTVYDCPNFLDMINTKNYILITGYFNYITSKFVCQKI